MRDVYVHTPSMLPVGEELTLVPWSDYLEGRTEDTFDSLHYLHLRSHGQLRSHEAPPMTWEGKYHDFVKSFRTSQTELAAAVLKASPRPPCQHFIYCHQTFPEDLHKCPAAWLRHVMNIQALETCTMEYQGGATWGLALEEAIEWVRSQSTSATSVIVGAERILAPIHRAHNPLGWLSDAAGVVSVSTDAPSEGPTYLCEDIVTHYHPHPFAWADRSCETVLNDTIAQLINFFSQHPYTSSRVIYPAYAPAVLEHFSHVHPGIAWQNGRCGMAHGLETLAVLAADHIPKYEQCLCLFIEPGEVIVGLPLRRVQ